MGCRPIHYAPALSTELCSLLIGAKADVNCKGRFNFTPLHELALSLKTFNDSKYYPIYRYFLTQGADINARSAFGKTPRQLGGSHEKKIAELEAEHEIEAWISQQPDPYYLDVDQWLEHVTNSTRRNTQG